MTASVTRLERCSELFDHCQVFQWYHEEELGGRTVRMKIKFCRL